MDAFRRAADIAVAAITLFVLSPVLFIFALFVRLTSKGPALFHQSRAGKHSVPFTIHKFRTMRIDADPYGPSPHEAADARLTGIGRFLRETSLDELPQFWNVLRGDMTLVGPRPLYMSQVAEWNDRQRTRLQVKPGLTGLAQITGRGGLTIEDKLELDAQYVERRSLGLDVKIIGRTFITFFKRKDIYEKRYSKDKERRD